MIGAIIGDVIGSTYEFWPPEGKDFSLWNKSTAFTDDTVPQAIVCFLESESFEDAIRNAVSLGGDADTMGAITGAMAWAYYGRDGIQKDMISLADTVRKEYLPQEFIDTLDAFESYIENHK